MADIITETTVRATHNPGTKHEGTVDMHIFGHDGSILVGVAGYIDEHYTVQHCWISFENLEKMVKIARKVRKNALPNIRKMEDERRAAKSTFEIEEETE